MGTRIFRAFGFLTLFGVCYLAGATAAELKDMGAKSSVISTDVFSESQDWGLGFGKEG